MLASTAVSSASGSDLAARLRERDLSAAPEVLNLVENRAPERRDEIAALLAGVSPATLGGEAPAHVVGITGPPGAGKSSLLAQLVPAWRARERTVAVLAVDPSSRRSGGSLLGDRARIAVDAGDRGVFVRSMAAGGRLGGLAPATRAAAHALAAAFDVVVIETVGVGQSETDVAEAADTVAVVVQPAAGDVLQFLKSGIMEIPDVLVVTKADLGAVALRSRRDLHAALRSLGAAETPVVAVSSLGARDGLRRARRRARRASLPARRAVAAARGAAGERARGLHRRARRARPARARRPACGREAARGSRRGAGRARADPRARGGVEPVSKRPAPRSAAPARSGKDEPVRASTGGIASRAVLLDLLIMLGAFVLVSAVAGLAGAPNLGTALSFGQIGFGLAAVYVMLRR